MKSDVLSFGEFMFCIMLGMGLMLGVVTSIMWIVDNWDDIVVRYKMWSILRFPRRIVFFVDKTSSYSARIEVWRGSSLLYEYNASEGDAVYSGSYLGRIHQMYKDQLEQK
jgi:hypothetical protein